ncbi:MAG: uracil-DNA glycosylase [Candidatus Zixiibacteriota bacterium]
MSRPPLDPRELLRRALAAQMDLGYHEVVLGKRGTIPSAEPVGVIAPSETVMPSVEPPALVVPAASAFQSGLEFMAYSQFKSVDEHYRAICNCQLCPLGQTRNKFVYGVGNPNARLMFIGEAPGADEDMKGEPFVGRAGQLLDRILAAMQLSRQEVYIANILKCRPPGNRDPQPDEAAKCTPYLREQIRIIKPKLLCALGRIAAQYLLSTTTPLGKLRNKWHEFEGIPLWVTYHPAALLRFPEYKKDTWADMQLLKARFDTLT